MLRSQLVRRAMAGDTAALIFACKTILGFREPRGDEFNVHVSATATASAKPASFAITEDLKKKLYEAALVIHREALQHFNKMKVEIDSENVLTLQILAAVLQTDVATVTNDCIGCHLTRH